MTEDGKAPSEWSDRRLVGLLIEFIDGVNRSLDHVNEIEVEASRDPLAITMEDYIVGAASYSPNEGPWHLDEEAMTRLCRDWLHDLDRHDRCLHDLPLAERP